MMLLLQIICAYMALTIAVIVGYGMFAGEERATDMRRRLGYD
jgi:hypothetical protein